MSYITSEYKDLSYLEGQDLVIIRGWKDAFEQMPEKVRFIKDYENTILIELTFKGSEYAVEIPSRSYKRMLPKCCLATGIFLLRVKDSGLYLTGNEVATIKQYIADDGMGRRKWGKNGHWKKI